MEVNSDVSATPKSLHILVRIAVPVVSIEVALIVVSCMQRYEDVTSRTYRATRGIFPPSPSSIEVTMIEIYRDFLISHHVISHSSLL
jgi:hypothetical protein